MWYWIIPTGYFLFGVLFVRIESEVEARHFIKKDGTYENGSLGSNFLITLFWPLVLLMLIGYGIFKLCSMLPRINTKKINLYVFESSLIRDRTLNPDKYSWVHKSAGDEFLEEKK